MSDKVLRASIKKVLNIARWAPSGDNAQPWSFQFLSDHDVLLLIRRTNPNIYEYRRGEPTLLSAGALLENINIAAPTFGLRANWRYLETRDDFDQVSIQFEEVAVSTSIELFDQIIQRSVDRRPFKSIPLSNEQKSHLSSSLGSPLTVEWRESFFDRARVSRLSALATNIRLKIPETFEVHRSIVEWDKLESEHAIPSRALGLDPLTLKLTRWSMKTWRRTKLMNALGAPAFASVQMDIIPGLCSAGYFVVRRRDQASEGATIENLLQAGQGIQRFWLTATELGLVIQPCAAILAFWVYATERTNFTSSMAATREAQRLARGAEELFGSNSDILFFGRIGSPRGKSSSRSTRLPLSDLLKDDGFRLPKKL